MSHSCFLQQLDNFMFFLVLKKILNPSFHLLEVEVTKMKNRRSRCPQMAHSITVQTSKHIITALNTCNIGGTTKAKKK